MDEIIAILKLNLGISHDQKDKALLEEIKAAKSELESKSIKIDYDSPEDRMLLVDFSLWRYKNKNEDIALPKSISYRIKNRIAKRRAENV